MEKCTYCGAQVERPDREDVVPKCLYRETELRNGPRLVKVPSCRGCNSAFSDDEAHFRNVLMLAGGTTQTVQRLWDGAVARSFRQPDGMRRMVDLGLLLKPVQTPDGPRHAIYPGSDPRVLRVVRKIVRGMSRHHGHAWPLADEAVFADVLKYEVPPAFEPDMRTHHIVPEVFYYAFGELDPDAGTWWWVLTFFERTRFVAWSSPAVVARPA